MKLPRFPSPYKWWGFSLCLAGIAVYFGYHLRDVFSGIVYSRASSGFGRTYTWEESPWWFTTHTAFMIVLAGLSTYVSVLTAIAGFSTFRLNRNIADAEKAIADADQAVAQAEKAADVSFQGKTDRVLADADRAIAEANHVLRSLDHESLAQEVKPRIGSDGPRADNS